ncbi:MAG: formate dehydrogenase accessory sulfurtransferase FdhD [Phycisphaerae bacterium]|nr:formate dehydrogenase accessory sulfurtransferase FdhD [Phycisphaerae bacterium]MDW8261248.1 formate dehydrogenase accessory sulfurtransferase FdhD [Phycisphaerales bacterium]
MPVSAEQAAVETTGSIQRPVQRLNSRGVTSQVQEHLAIEEPLEIRVRGRPISVTLRTPGHDRELTLGFLIGEGVIRSIDDVISVDPCLREDGGNVINVVLRPEVPVDFQRLTRHVFASSSCGLCGKTTIESLRRLFSPLETVAAPSVDVLCQLPAKMRAAQPLFDQTGGVHAAALFSGDGSLLALYEDVGRHNAVDKLIGHAASTRLLPLDRQILLVSGRASFEIVQKALAARIGVIAAVSAASSLAAEFAQTNGQWLFGFLREGRLTCYSSPAGDRPRP